MAATLAQFGRLDESVAIVDRAIAASGGSSFMVSLRGQLAALAGRRDDALGALKDLDAMSGQRYVSAYHCAVVHAALGDRDTAIDDLERAFDERSSWLVYVNVSPLLKPLRSEPRFIALLERLGLQSTQ
jgi:tetratricopeptide (TPR) repeat protein